MLYYYVKTHNEAQEELGRYHFQDIIDNNYDSDRVFIGDDSYKRQGFVFKYISNYKDYNNEIVLIDKTTSKRKFVLHKELVVKLDQRDLNVDDKLLSNELFDILISYNSELSNKILKNFDNLEVIDNMKDLTLLKNGFISYKTNNKIIKSKIGKAILKVLTIAKEPIINTSSFNSKLETLTNYLKACTGGAVGFKEIKGKAIKNYYHESFYDWDNNIGTLAKSCMRHSGCQEWLDLYVDNCSLLIYSLPKGVKGKITGRALLWQLDTGEIFMDRIYGDDATRALFVSYAQEKNYIFKRQQKHDDKEFFIKNNNEIKQTIKFKLKKSLSSYTTYPYLDTFTYDAGDNFICNTEEFAEIGKFDDIRGGYKEIMTCSISGKKGFDSSYFYEYVTEEGERKIGHIDYIVQINNGNFIDKKEAVMTASGYWYHKKNLDIVFIKSLNVYEHLGEVFTCEIDGLTYPRVFKAYGRAIRLDAPSKKKGKFICLLNWYKQSEENINRNETTDNSSERLTLSDLTGNISYGEHISSRAFNNTLSFRRSSTSRF